MRIGEVRNKVWKIINENDQVVIESEAIYGGQAYIVSDWNNLIEAFDIMSEHTWNDINYAPIEDLKKEHGTEQSHAEISQADFNKLNQYVSELNSKIKYFVSVVESLVEDQDEQVINIKLPGGIQDLDGLSALNGRVDKLFKCFAVDGGYEFIGFDKGSEWYEVLFKGALTYKFFIAGLDIADKYFQTRKSFFEMKEAKLHYLAATEEKEFTEEKFEEYKKRYLKEMVRQEVEQAVASIGNGNKDTNELINDVVIATNNLIKEIDDHGTKFHLSLNPPDYISGDAGSLKIDYEKMALKSDKKEKKEIEAPRDKKGEENK